MPVPRIALPTRRPIIFTEIYEDPSAPQLKAEKQSETRQEQPVETLEIIIQDEALDKEDVGTLNTSQEETKKDDITTIMDPTSLKDIKVRVSKMPPLPRSPRRLCTSRLPQVPRRITPHPGAPPGAAS